MPSPDCKNGRFWLLAQRIILPTLAFMWAASGLAGPTPQYAFSVQSLQIPGGIFPLSLGADVAGNVYVASGANVIKLAPNGANLNRWGTFGTGPGQFAYPGPFAFDHATNVYAIDSYNNRIEKFDQNGRYITGWGTSGTNAGQFDTPDGIAVDSFDRVFVADNFNNRIQVFSSSGGFLTQFGSTGTNGGQFLGPGVITIDSSNNLYVIDVPVDYTNFRVQKFDVNGTFLAQWPAYGNNPTNFIEIAGLTTDPSNNVYVSDGANNDIQKFSSDGTFLGEWGSGGSGLGQFNTPMGIGIDPSGNYVYVADYYNTRIEVFAYSPLGPIVYQSPTNQTIPAGTTLTVSAGVFGAQTLAYQWQYNGQDVSGATDSALVISNAPLTASGSYGLTVTNAMGTAISSNAAISVLPVVVTTLSATRITATSALMEGSATLGANASSVWFEWGTDTNYGNISGLASFAANTNVSLSQLLNNLSGAIVYHYRLSGSNSLGVVHGQDAQVQVGLQPTVANLPISAMSSTSVVLNASVNADGRDTTYFFRWGFSAYGHNTPTNDIGGGASAVTVQSQITGLQAGSLYHAQAVASNALGVVATPDFTFVAPPWSILSAPLTLWASIGDSADGSILAAVANGDHAYVSTNYGSSWITNNSPSLYWRGIAVSADGTKMVAVANGGSPSSTGPAYISTNHGVTWFPSAAALHYWAAVGSSGDGNRLIGADTTGLILTSTNSGKNWFTNGPPVLAAWNAVSSSPDGQHLMIAAGGLINNPSGPLLISTNAGLSWITNSLGNQYWTALASSADGQTLFAAAGGIQHIGSIYVSTNAGINWSVTGVPVTNWQTLACSADGTTLTAANSEGRGIFTSTNTGASWQTQVLPSSGWSSVATSADGARLYAAGDQNLFTLQNIPAPKLNVAAIGSQLGLSWVVPSVPFTVQSAASVVAPQWSSLATTPTLSYSNLSYQIQVLPSAAAAFYRLSSP
jgi:DNA-binding beta-propeller fold protein YncE